MILKRIKIRNFRNYESINVDFDTGIHMIVGANGQGKTNLLESIYYLSCTKSHRIKEDQNLIRHTYSFFNLEGIVVKDHKEIDICCNLNEQGKNLFLYRNVVSRVSDYIGFFNAVMFYPDDMNLFSAPPKRRRQFIDLELGKLSKTYTRTLNDFYKVLKERNHYLKNDKIDNLFLDTLDDQLIFYEVRIARQRKKFLDDILNKSASFYKQLSNDNTMIKAVYLSDCVYDDSEDKMKQLLKDKYNKGRDRDIYFKTTAIGIHHDDYVFYMNDNEVNVFASQGQKRILLLSLKLGIVYTIYEILKEYPVLILDDVFSELDEDKRKKLLVLLPEDIQIFISTTDFIEVVDERKITYYEIKDGKIDMIRRNSRW